MNKELLEILLGFKRALKLIDRREKIVLVFASVLMAFAGVLTNLPAVILGRLVDQITKAGDNQFSIAIPYIFAVIFVILIREALTIIRKYLVENIATQTEKKQTVNVISHLLRTDVSIIANQQIGSIHGRIFRSLEGLVRIIKLSFLEFLPIFFSALAAVLIALYQKPLLASVMILVIPTTLLIVIKQISSQKGVRVSLLRGKEKIDGTVVEMLGGIETVRVLNTEDLEIEKVNAVAEELRKKEIKHHIFMAFFDSAKYLNEGFFYIVVISLSIYFSAIGIISQGDILVYSILFLSITAPLREIHRILDQAHESSILVNDLYGLLNEPTDESFKSSDTKETNGELEDSAISIKNLTFSYPNRSVKALSDINLRIKNGEKIGIAGASGCGKSTLIKILLRLLHNYSGEVELFGKNLKTINRDEIAKRVAYVPQKTYIFSGTIRDNIIYGCQRKNITDSEIIEAANKANIYQEIISDLGGPGGRVTEGGNNLSGGQRQRLALARLILNSPEIFIFDEATSALDNSNESLIQKNIEKLFSNKTMITIAHRLTTLENSNRILVFDNGKIVQEGTFKKLSAEKGLFQDFLKQKSSI